MSDPTDEMIEAALQVKIADFVPDWRAYFVAILSAADKARPPVPFDAATRDACAATPAKPLSPLKVKPEQDQRYWKPNFDWPKMANSVAWADDKIDNHRFAHGLCFATAAEAVECAKWTLAAVKQEGGI